LENHSYSSQGWKNVLLIIVPFLVAEGIFQYMALRVLGLDFSSIGNLTTDDQFFIIAFFDLIAVSFVVTIFTVYVVKKKFVSVGLRPVFILNDIVIGILAGLVVMLAALLILVETGQVTIKSIDRNVTDSLWILGTFVFVGISEELLLRGYVLNNLMVSFNKYIALGISSALFAFMHIANPNLDIFGIFGLFFAGLLLGYSYIVTGNLWLPISLHFSWNFFQSFLGFNVSGHDFYSFVITTFAKANVWNGGNFGFEGSVISLIFQAMTIAVFYYALQKRRPGNAFNPPSDFDKSA
jgi:membrane protease YdiL (CAAX protease family)